jgi:hypothetical protein
MNRCRLLVVAGLVLSASLALVSVALGAGPYAGFVTVVDGETATGMRGLTAKETDQGPADRDRQDHRRSAVAPADRPSRSDLVVSGAWGQRRPIIYECFR